MKSEASLKKLLEQRSSLHKELEKWMNQNLIITFFGISPNTLKKWRWDKKVEFTRYCGIILYNWQDIVQVLEKNKVTRKQ